MDNGQIGQADLDGLLRSGLQHHQAGRIADAERCYRQMLAIAPDHPDGLHLLGVIADQTGQQDAAAALIRRAIAVRPDQPSYHLHLGMALRRRGALDEAAECYRQALALDPHFLPALNSMGVVLRAQGKLDEAVASYDRLLALNPRYAEGHSNKADALFDQGELDQAVASYDRAIDLNPSLVNALERRGSALLARGDLADALSSYDRAITLRPDFVEAHFNRGIALSRQANFDDAVASFERAIELRPDYAAAHANRADALQANGKLADAVTGYDRAIELGLDTAALHANRGQALGKLDERDRAVAAYDRALALDPDQAEVHFYWASLVNDRGEFAEAVAGYDRALALKPDFMMAHYNRGTSLRNQNLLDEAAASFARAVALAPDNAVVHAQLGMTLQARGKLEEAAASLERAAELAPDSFEHACAAKLIVPVMLRSADEVAPHRARYRSAIQELMSFPGELKLPEYSNAVTVFNLAYHNFDDRGTLEARGELLRAKAPSLTFEAPSLGAWRPPSGNRRIRIGFVSEFFHRRHTIGKLYRGLLRHLDPSRFDSVLFHASTAIPHVMVDDMNTMAGKWLRLPPTLARQRQVIADEQLDVVFYADIGMTKESYLLAFARLAPVQAVGWGHPITTGLSSLDYFISARGLEPTDATRHYTEHLILLDRLPCCYEEPAVADVIPGRKALGLPETGALYGCPQSLFKLHPDFDAVLAEIAAGDPGGHIVMIDGHDPSWREMLRQRWSQRHPSLVDRVLFLPRQPIDRFLALMAHFDVLLDPVHFGSGNTLYEAMAYGTPIVTWPGQFMRGRIVAAAYDQMGIANPPVARTMADYAPLALALARDPVRRAALRRASRAAAPRLYDDRQAVRDFEAFAEAAVDAAGRGEKLPSGWRPGLVT